MSLSIRRLTVLTSALVAVLAMTATAAFAQYPPPAGLALACERSGNQVVCVLANAQASDTCTATLTQQGREVDSDTQETDAQGEASFDLTAADDSAASVAATCVLSAGAAADDVAAIGVTAPPTTGTPGTPVSGTGTLPFTGTEVGMLLALAFGLIGTGLVALRRREDRKVSI